MARNYWETHLYTYAVVLTQGDNIKPENLAGMRRKAINNGHTEAECIFVQENTKLYITNGTLNRNGFATGTADDKLARERALKISKGRFIAITQLHNDVEAFVARFSSDEGLRCFAQSLIQHGDRSVGIVIKCDGTIPREAEARELLTKVSKPKREGAQMPTQGDMTPEQIAKQLEIKHIAEQNDYFRQQPPENGTFGKWVCTASIHAEGPDFVFACFRAVCAYDDFTEDNDPFGSHEMGFMEVRGKKVWWKIDFYNPTYEAGSENPSSLNDTRRVLTILFPSDY